MDEDFNDFYSEFFMKATNMKDFDNKVHAE